MVVTTLVVIVISFLVIHITCYIKNIIRISNNLIVLSQDFISISGELTEIKRHLNEIKNLFYSTQLESVEAPLVKKKKQKKKRGNPKPRTDEQRAMASQMAKERWARKREREAVRPPKSTKEILEELVLKGDRV